MKIVKDTLVTLLTQIITTILAMIGIIIIARVLGPNGKGIYTLVILVPTLLVSLGNLGIGVANAYFVGKRKYLFKDIISNSFIVGLGLGIILAIAFIIYFLLCKPSFLKNIKPEWIFITTFTLPFYLLMIYFQHILLGENKINGYNLVSLIRSSILLIFLCILLFVFRMRMLGPILAWTTGVIMAAILGIFLVCRLKLDWSFNWLLFKDCLLYTSPSPRD